MGSELLFKYPSLFDPLVFLFIVVCVGGLTVTFALRPQLYIPLLLIAAPLPKLFSIGVTEQTIAFDSYQVLARPGISVVELVIAAGALAWLGHGQRALRHKSSSRGRAILWCGASVAFSLVLAGLLDPLFRPSQLLYGIRHIATIGAFFLARHYAALGKPSVSSLAQPFRVLRVSGNVVIALGVIYYFTLGSDWSPNAMDAVVRAGGAGIWRNYLWFFDYAYDFGFFVALIALLNLTKLLKPRRVTQGLFAFACISLCTIAAILTGQRGSLVILAIALGAFTYFSARQTGPRHGWAGMGAKAIFAAVVVILVAGAWLSVLAPERIMGKIGDTRGIFQEGIAETTAKQLGVPSPVADWLGAIPIGDFAVRLAMNAASIWYFLQHPWGVGFGGELYVTGWLSHFELSTIAVEQGLLGLVCYCILLRQLLRFAFRRPRLAAWSDDDAVILRSLTVAFVAASLFALTAIFLQKFGFVYWTLLGVFEGQRVGQIGNLRSLWTTQPALS